jgi:hypothetical protein
MEEQNYTREVPEVHHIWIGEQERIASFHEVDTYHLQIITGHDDFVKYLQLLQEQGFRFQ